MADGMGGGGGFFAGTLFSLLTLNNTGFNKGITESQQKAQKLGMAMTAVGGLIVAAMVKSTKAATGFNKEMANISTLTTPAITNINTLKESIRTLAVDAGKSTSDVAGGMYQVISAFGEGADVVKSLEINVRGAAAGMATTTEAINLTSAVTKGFGDISSEAQQKVMDLSFLTVKLGQTDFPQLASSIGKTVPLMAAMGGKQEELFAGFATLTGVTGTAAEVSTQFSGVLGAMIKPSTAMAAAIKQVGREQLGLADASGKTLVEEMGLVGAFKAIISTTDGSMTSLGKLIRRKEALTAILSLTGAQAGVFDEKLIAMTKSSGAANEAFEKMTQGINKEGFAMEQATVKMEIATQRLGEAALPIMAAFKTAIASVVEGISNWMKENPLLAKGIVTITTALAGLMVVTGPLLIAVSKLNGGFGALKNTLTGLPGLFTKLASSAVGKLGLITVATYGLVKAIGAMAESLTPTLKQFEAFSMLRMGFTEKGEQALFLRNQLVELAKQINPNVTGLRAAAQAIADNKEQYEKLHPRLKRIVDNMAEFKTQTEETAQSLPKLTRITAENLEAIQGITEVASLRIRELTMSDTDFKIAELTREHEENVRALEANKATKADIAILERQHALELQQIRDEAQKVRIEKEKKAEAERIKQEEKRFKELADAIEKEEQMQEAHQATIEGFRKEQQQLILKETQEREGWRAAELQKVEFWHEQQTALAENRYNNDQINFEQLAIEKAKIKQLYEEKMEDIEGESRRRRGIEDKNHFQSFLNLLSGAITKATGIFQTYLNSVTSFFSASMQYREERLNSWYENEKIRIQESAVSNEEKTRLLENLDAQMHSKKAALEEAAKKREGQIALAQAVANTAVAVTKAIAALPWPFNLPLIAFAVTTGALQIAAIKKSMGASGGGGINVGDVGGGGSGGGGGETIGLGGGGGSGGGAGTIGGGGAGNIEAFQAGTDGFITPPQKFTVGEPLSTEFVQMSGNLDQVKMKITPLQGQGQGQGGQIMPVVNVYVTAMDAASFQEKIQNEIIPEIQRAMQVGLLNIPRDYIR
jgi:TP901 family phage tail tape measure protein